MGVSTIPLRTPAERPFTAAERGRVTILFGGLTSKHEKLIASVFQSAGYKAESLPTPDVTSFQIGKEYGNNGQCNPTYFTVGQLIQFLQRLEAAGAPRQQIIDGYVFFTAGSCGPCRFGMYEAEFRHALQNAGFEGFRVLLFQQTDGIKAASGEPGLKFTVDFGMGDFDLGNWFYKVLQPPVPSGRPPARRTGAPARQSRRAGQARRALVVSENWIGS